MDQLQTTPTQGVPNQEDPPLASSAPRKFNLIFLTEIIFIILVSVGGIMILKNFNNSHLQTTLPQSTTTPQPFNISSVAANWKTYNISGCLARFNYPSEWQTHLSDKGNCTIQYWQPPIGSQPMDTFVTFDVQPEFFLGKLNIEIDPAKVISKSKKEGVEKTIEYSEEKDQSRPIYLSLRIYLFKKGPIYFRILGQYEKGDKDFENTLDKVSESVAIDGDETFYSNYIKKLENDLRNFAPK